MVNLLAVESVTERLMLVKKGGVGMSPLPFCNTIKLREHPKALVYQVVVERHTMAELIALGMVKMTRDVDNGQSAAKSSNL